MSCSTFVQHREVGGQGEALCPATPWPLLHGRGRGKGGWDQTESAWGNCHKKFGERNYSIHYCWEIVKAGARWNDSEGEPGEAAEEKERRDERLSTALSAADETNESMTGESGDSPLVYRLKAAERLFPPDPATSEKPEKGIINFFTWTWTCRATILHMDMVKNIDTRNYLTQSLCEVVSCIALDHDSYRSGPLPRRLPLRPVQKYRNVLGEGSCHADQVHLRPEHAAHQGEIRFPHEAHYVMRMSMLTPAWEGNSSWTGCARLGRGLLGVRVRWDRCDVGPVNELRPDLSTSCDRICQRRDINELGH